MTLIQLTRKSAMKHTRFTVILVSSYALTREDHKGEEFCRRACTMGADIALFPEMWNIGYTSFVPDTDDIEDDIWKAPALWSQVGKPNISPDLERTRIEWQAQAITCFRLIPSTTLRFGQCLV